MIKGKRIILITLCMLHLIVSSSIAQDLAQYTVKAAGKSLTFVPRGDLGFVLKSKEQIHSIDIYSELKNSNTERIIRDVKGLDRDGILIILDETQNSEISNLKSQISNFQYSSPLFSVSGQTVAIIPEIVVHLAFDSISDLRTQCQKLGLTIKKQMEFSTQEYLIDVPASNADAVFSAVEQLNMLPFIEWAVPNTAFVPFLFDQVIPNDEYFPKQWHLYNYGQSLGLPHADVNAPAAWELTTGDPNIIIAVLDTGVDVNHPDLINNIVPGYDFLDDDNLAAPSLNLALDGHGTNCAGLAAARGNNGIGVAGVAWNCKIMPIRIANGEDFITDADIATAIRWAAQHGADILSMSWGSLESSNIINSAITDITSRNNIGRNGKGCVVVAAAGNWEDGGPVTYPAAYPSVIAVGATDNRNEHLNYSATGPALDIVAPSGPGSVEDHDLRGKEYLWTTDIIGKYGYSMHNLNRDILDYTDRMSGTSGACPIVAGVAALVLSVDPNLTSVNVRGVLLDSAVDLGVPGSDEFYGYGLVDAFAAVEMTLNLSTTHPSSSIILYVDDNAFYDPGAGDPNISDPNEDGTPNHPFDSIQEAIDFALYAENIIVSDGIYTGQGNHDIDFSGKALKIHSENGAENCIINCENSGRGFYFHNSEAEDSILDGFTIKNGKAYEGAGIKCSGDSSPTLTNLVFIDNFVYSWGQKGGDGGGIYVDSGCSPVISDCSFIENSAVWNGGGLYIDNANLNLDNCIFQGNLVGYYGGGLFNDTGSLTLSNCVFTDNSAQINGGGMHNVEASLELTGCVFTKNKAIDGYGGAFSNDYGDTIFNDCNFISNSSRDWGGAVYNNYGSVEYSFCNFMGNISGQGGAIYDDGGYPKLTNCILTGNSAVNSGGALFCNWSDVLITNCTFASNTAKTGKAIACDSDWFSSDIQITNCILWDSLDEIDNNDGSTFAIKYSNVMKQGTSWTGQGNLNVNPLFADPNNDDYHLKSQAGRWNPVSQSWVTDSITSPCIDTGNPSSDFSAETMPNGGRINMGAYGGTIEASKSDHQAIAVQ
jgi:subtilisin family serine protease